MPYIVNDSDQSGKSHLVLADIESVLDDAGWGDLGQFADGTHTWHAWQAPEPSDSRIPRAVAVFRVRNDATLGIRLYGAEGWRDSDGRVSKPVVGRVADQASLTIPAASVSARPWLRQDGGDLSVGAPVGNYATGNPWWWPIDTEPVHSRQIPCVSSTWLRWLVVASPTSVSFATFDAGVAGSQWMGSVQAVPSLQDWMELGSVILASHGGTAALSGLDCSYNRTPVHPDFEQYVSPDYGDSVLANDLLCDRNMFTSNVAVVTGARGIVGHPTESLRYTTAAGGPSGGIYLLEPFHRNPRVWIDGVYIGAGNVDVSVPHFILDPMVPFLTSTSVGFGDEITGPDGALYLCTLCGPAGQIDTWLRTEQE